MLHLGLGKSVRSAILGGMAAIYRAFSGIRFQYVVNVALALAGKPSQFGGGGNRTYRSYGSYRTYTSYSQFTPQYPPLTSDTP